MPQYSTSTDDDGINNSDDNNENNNDDNNNGNYDNNNMEHQPELNQVWLKVLTYVLEGDGARCHGLTPVKPSLIGWAHTQNDPWRCHHIPHRPTTRTTALTATTVVRTTTMTITMATTTTTTTTTTTSASNQVSLKVLTYVLEGNGARCHGGRHFRRQVRAGFRGGEFVGRTYERHLLSSAPKHMVDDTIANLRHETTWLVDLSWK